MSEPGVPTEQEGPSILFHGNAPWAGTGYGTQAALFGPLISGLGYRLAFSSFYGLAGSKIGWQDPRSKKGFVVYPAARDAYGNDVLHAHLQDWRRGEEDALLLTLTDPWVLNAGVIARMPVAAWTPVDHDPLMPRTDEWFQESGAIPIAMSRFGFDRLSEEGHDPLYVPHGFDPGTFQLGNREAARDLFGIPKDAFVVGMVSANKSGGQFDRKSFGHAISAFAKFQERCPQALLYLHTQLQAPDGMDIMAICESKKVLPRTSDQYRLATGQPDMFVASLMQLFDCLLCPSTGEGFGVPLVEAQACGVPCITTNFSAMPEVAPVAAGNLTVEGQEIWTAFDSWQRHPNVEEIVHKLEVLYSESAEDTATRRARVHAWAHQEYTAQHVTETYWRPALKETFTRAAYHRARAGTRGH